jgi:hypothetical protein
LLAHKLLAHKTGVRVISLGAVDFDVDHASGGTKHDADAGAGRVAEDAA